MVARTTGRYAIEAGFEHHLAKPASLEKLEALLANLSPSRRLTREDSFAAST